MTAPYVNHTIKDGISTIEFFHPAHNSLPGDLLAKLADTITQAGENDAVKVLILKSRGPWVHRELPRMRIPSDRNRR